MTHSARADPSAPGRHWFLSHVNAIRDSFRSLFGRGGFACELLAVPTEGARDGDLLQSWALLHHGARFSSAPLSLAALPGPFPRRLAKPLSASQCGLPRRPRFRMRSTQELI